MGSATKLNRPKFTQVLAAIGPNSPRKPDILEPRTCERSTGKMTFQGQGLQNPSGIQKRTPPKNRMMLHQKKSRQETPDRVVGEQEDNVFW